jgi:hypothetical protein
VAVGAERERRAAAAKARQLIAALDSADSPAREAAHRELERLAPRIVAELRSALLSASGEKAERLNAVLRLAGENAPAADESRRLSRLREVLTWSSEKADRDTLQLLDPPQ